MTVQNPGDLEAFAADTVVYAAAAPLAYTDLDISAVVGARVVLVVLEIVNGLAGGTRYYIRPNGEIVSTSPSGIESGVGTANAAMWLVTKTDANGIFEWISAANDATTVRVKAYIVLS